MAQTMEPSRTAETTTNHKPTPVPICPNCKSRNVIKSGIRRAKKKTSQRYFCKNCQRIFTPNPLKRTSYPPHVILNAVSLYNLGHTLEQTRSLIRKQFKMDPREPTILSWLTRHQDICTFIPLRKRYSLDPKTTVKSKKLYHTQVYDLKYHDLKLNLAANKFPELRQYIREILDHCPHELFRAESPRCSSLRIDIKPRKATKNNNAPKLAEYGLVLAKTNKERHEKVEEFMLINDSATVAIELPVYLHPNELTNHDRKSLGLDITDTLTGHIDLLQVRFNQIHVLDYKPDAKKTDRKAAEQVFLYALALSKHTNIPLESFTCAYFDERNYYQFNPTDKSAKTYS